MNPKLTQVAYELETYIKRKLDLQEMIDDITWGGAFTRESGEEELIKIIEAELNAWKGGTGI